MANKNGNDSLSLVFRIESYWLSTKIRGGGTLQSRCGEISDLCGWCFSRKDQSRFVQHDVFAPLTVVFVRVVFAGLVFNIGRFQRLSSRQSSFRADRYIIRVSIKQPGPVFSGNSLTGKYSLDPEPRWPNLEPSPSSRKWARSAILATKERSFKKRPLRRAPCICAVSPF